MGNITYTIETFWKVHGVPMAYVVWKFKDGKYFREMPGLYANYGEAHEAIKTFSQKSEN
jgi:hypothetical protein